MILKARKVPKKAMGFAFQIEELNQPYKSLFTWFKVSF